MAFLSYAFILPFLSADLFPFDSLFLLFFLCCFFLLFAAAPDAPPPPTPNGATGAASLAFAPDPLLPPAESCKGRNVRQKRLFLLCRSRPRARASLAKLMSEPLQ